MVKTKGQEESALRKLIIYAALAAAALMVPTEATELGKMKPVETVYMYMKDDEVVIMTDSDDTGRGETIKDALVNLKETTAGTIYLDTAMYLLVSQDALTHVSELAPHLKNTVRVCTAEGEIQIKEVAAFLTVHKPSSRLREWRKNMDLDVLKAENGRHILLRK